MRQSHKIDALEHVTAGAGSASLSATSHVVPPRRASRVRASSSPRYTAALAASAFCLLRFSMLRQALQNGASDAPDAFAAAALASLLNTARGEPRHNGTRCST